MTQTTARITKSGKHFEILVDLDEALKFKKGEGNINSAVLTDAIFHNLKSGEHASVNDLELNFGTSDPIEVAEKIIKGGEVVRTTESMNKEQEQKYKQVVDALVRSAVSPEGRPYTSDRIMKALHEAHINVKNKPIEEQLGEIIDHLRKILPLKIEVKKVKLRIPVLCAAKAYGVVKEYIKKEDWQNNGDLDCIVEVPSALIMDFYDRLNNMTHGSVVSEEIKE
ncbi:ribosome assembly factor SBDS [Candidatus Woesearchaeota archaeon]|jgi:ribosome maturation protein SDO1|nr:ribosome assembly factor SBDS [Candidatus Woesearchaeota archaeon]